MAVKTDLDRKAVEKVYVDILSNPRGAKAMTDNLRREAKDILDLSLIHI